MAIHVARSPIPGAEPGYSEQIATLPLISPSLPGAPRRYDHQQGTPLPAGRHPNHLYGHDRLATVRGSARLWYAADALLSVRQTFGDSGTVLGITNYDPWGNVETGSVPTFGFTGELQDSAAGLIYLRARWYSTRQGRFGARDPFHGDPERPYSQHPYQYGSSDPVLMTDPSGQCVEGTRNSATDTCNKAYQAAMGILGLDSERHSYLYTKFDTAQFTELYNWGQAGVRLSNTSYWHTTPISNIMRALRRIQQAVGGSQDTVRRMLFDQPLLFNYSVKHGDGATYQSYRTPTYYEVPFIGWTYRSVASKDRIDMTFGNSEQVLIHELGHRFDNVADGLGFWSSSLAGQARTPWMVAAGWQCVTDAAGNQAYSKEGKPLYAITAAGAAWAVSEYAVTGETVFGMQPKFYQLARHNHLIDEGIQSQAEYAAYTRNISIGGNPAEDFAETFAWYVFNQTGGVYGLSAGVANSRNKNKGEPDEQRLTALKTLITYFGGVTQ